MSVAIRLAPSGPVIGGDTTPLSFGSGARLRLAESNSVMGGSLAVPTPGDAADAIISPDGFGDPDALVLTLDSPREGYKYRAELALDLINVTTNADAEVVLYLDVSTDGGGTYINFAKNAHHVRPSGETVGTARQAEVHLPLTTGNNLGVLNSGSTPSPSIKLRARAILTAGATGSAEVDSSATSGAETGLAGTIHMQLEECFPG